MGYEYHVEERICSKTGTILIIAYKKEGVDIRGRVPTSRNTSPYN